MNNREQDEADRRLGEMVRALWDRRHRVDLHNLLDDGAACAWGGDHSRSTGDTLDEAVELAAHRAGIMDHARTLPPPRPEQVTLPEIARPDREMPSDKFRNMRGKP